MPYITQDDRHEMAADLSSLNNYMESDGDLNYAITTLLLMQQPKRYADYNRLIGVLECCKLEFYRRAVAAYEDEKREENGDVY